MQDVCDERQYFLSHHSKQFTMNTYIIENIQSMLNLRCDVWKQEWMHNYSNKPINRDYSMKIREKGSGFEEAEAGRLMTKSCQDSCALNLIRDIV